MNDATLRQATATARDSAADLEAAAKDLEKRATDAIAGGGKRLDDDLRRTTDDIKSAAKEAGTSAKHIDDVAKAAELAASEPAALDDIERIERRMNERRASIRRHLNEAKDNVERTVHRTTRSWPIVATGAVVAALAVGYVVAQRSRPSSRARRTAKSVWQKAREAPEAARRYVHEATKPPSRVWTERVAAATGFAMAVVRALPQLRALAATMSQARARR